MKLIGGGGGGEGGLTELFRGVNIIHVANNGSRLHVHSTGHYRMRASHYNIVCKPL